MRLIEGPSYVVIAGHTVPFWAYVGAEGLAALACLGIALYLLRLAKRG